jgi:hypothetical protein
MEHDKHEITRLTLVGKLLHARKQPLAFREVRCALWQRAVNAAPAFRARLHDGVADIDRAFEVEMA